MRMQDSQANCGPAAMSNALAALGIVRTQAECEIICGTDATKGTQPKKLLKALRGVEGIEAAVLLERRIDVALMKLEGSLRHGRPVIACVDNGSHWVAVVGLLGERFLVADSADNELVLSYAPGDLAKRWAEEARKPYYGVIL